MTKPSGMSLRAGQGLTRLFVVFWAALCFSAVLAPAPAQEGGVVSTVGSRYIPGDVSLGASTLRLIQGTELTYANLDPSFDHSVTSDLTVGAQDSTPVFESGLVRFRRSALVTGTADLQPGVYGFHCQIHFGMNGTLTVIAS